MSLNQHLESVSSDSEDQESDFAGDKDDGNGHFGSKEGPGGSQVSLGF